ncbi:MAG: hypothetical protein HY774_08825 [Acidobacteria bacterium]|nr:hypothetical protein [Acidobacteriota bacterium]
MKKTDQPVTTASSARTPEKGMMGEVRTIFDQALERVHRQAALDRQRQPITPLGKVVNALFLAGILTAIGVLFYGFWQFPDAPIRKTPQGYVGKTGQPRTESDYMHFVWWERTLVVTFCSALALGFTSMLTGKAEKPKEDD